jgi:hypothetical protein
MSRAAAHKRNITLAIRIQSHWLSGLKVLNTNQGQIHALVLVPWLRCILTTLRLPHPKPTNIVKPGNDAGVVDMYWDIESTNVRACVLHLYDFNAPDSPFMDQPMVGNCVRRCVETETSTLQEMSM